MARQKSFEPDRALDMAMRAFWAKGYESTSVEDLVEATGINRASLYGTFGGKREMFLKALDRYIHAGEVARAEAEAASSGARAALAALFDRLVVRASDGRHAGCLLTNSVAEFGSRDPEVLDALRRALANMENGLDRIVRRAIDQGEASDNADPRARARLLVAAMQGLQVVSKINPDGRTLRQIADQAIDAALS